MVYNSPVHSMAKMKLWCGVHGRGIVFAIEIGLHQTVADLQEVIGNTAAVNKSPSSMALYLPKDANGCWLKLSFGVTDILVGEIDTNYTNMVSSWKLGRVECFGPNFESAEDRISILVAEETVVQIQTPDVVTTPSAPFPLLPRKQHVAISELGKYSALQRSDLPPPCELANILRRPLSLSLKLMDKEVEAKFTPGEVSCADVDLAVDFFLVLLGSRCEAFAECELDWHDSPG